MRFKRVRSSSVRMGPRTEAVYAAWLERLNKPESTLKLRFFRSGDCDLLVVAYQYCHDDEPEKEPIKIVFPKASWRK